MNILVLGGAGFLGSNLVRRCISETSVKVTVMDSLDPLLYSSIDNLKDILDQIDFVRGDLRDENALAHVVVNQDIIFNCAAQTSHPLSMQYPLMDVDINCVGNIRLLEAVRLFNKEAIIIYPSSSTVIGKSAASIIDESHQERPLDIYSANKGVVEKYYRIYHTAHQLKTVILRFANLYGPYGKGYPEFGFINYFIQLAHDGKPITLYGAGNQMRNVMYVRDAVEIMWRAAFLPELRGEIYFAVGKEHLSVSNIANIIVDVFKKGCVERIAWPEDRKKIEIDNVMFSGEKLHSILAWQPQVLFEAGIKETKNIFEIQGRC